MKNESDQVPSNAKSKVLLVVSKSIENSSESFSTSTVPSSTIPEGEEECKEAFCVEESSENLDNLESKDENVTTTVSSKSEDPKEAMANLAQWIQILRNLAPILPVIPSLINSLKNGENPPTSSAINKFPGGGFDPTMPSGEQIFNWKNFNEKRLSPISTVAPIVQKSSQDRIPNFEAPIKNSKNLQNLNLSSLTVNELKTLESIHKKIFPINQKSEKKKIKKTNFGESKHRIQGIPKIKSMTSSSTSSTTDSPVVIFEKPKQITKVNSEANPDISKQFRYLTPEMIRELNMISNLPDLEPLTEGLDLSLLNKPGGFAILKQQFLQRLFQRIPLRTEDSDLLLSSK